MSIVAFDRPFAKLFQKPDGSYVREEKNWPDCIGVGYGGDYGIFTGPNKEFMICHLGTEDKPEVRLCAKFLPTEISDLLKSLFYQAAKGMGRTSAAELIDIIEYRFSPEFDKDQEKFSSKK